uniref:Uncharacterized protein n=1 Tax=Apteryx owenii TaxID=8824 RepID=A0A8B9NV45_APTOW
MSEQMTLCGTLKGHDGWVMQIATTLQFLDRIFSASHDKTIMMTAPCISGTSSQAPPPTALWARLRMC